MGMTSANHRQLKSLQAWRFRECATSLDGTPHGDPRLEGVPPGLHLQGIRLCQMFGGVLSKWHDRGGLAMAVGREAVVAVQAVRDWD